MKVVELIQILFLIVIFSSSVITLDEKDKITKVEDLITLVNSKEFKDFE
jgi:hypothetical protein